MVMETLCYSEKTIQDPSLPVSSLCLLVPPLRLLSAAMLQVVFQEDVMHHGKLEEFVSVVMEAVPELLSDSQWTQLTLELQAREGSLLGFSSKSDSALHVLLWEFLSRLEQLLPIPDLRQTLSWLSAAPSVLEECVQSILNPQQLRTILKHNASLGCMNRIANPSMDDCVLSSMSPPPFRRLVDSTKLTNSNSQSDCITEFRTFLSSATSEIKAESVMDSTYNTGVEPSSSVNRGEDTEESTEKSGGAISEEEEDILIKMKQEDEDGGERRSVEMERMHGATDEVRLRVNEEIKKEEQEEKGVTQRGTQTEKWENEGKSGGCQQEGEEQSSVATSCLIKQPIVLIRRLETGHYSLPVPIKRAQRGRSPWRQHELSLQRRSESLKQEGQVMTWKRRTVSQLDGPKKLPPSSSEKEICTEAPFISPVISPRNQNTGNLREVTLHQHPEKVHPEEHSRPLNSGGNGAEKPLPPSSTHQHPNPPEIPPTPTTSHTSTSGAHVCSQCGKDFIAPCYLKRHELTHTGERPYCCSQCGKGFSRPYRLRRHLQIHTRERSFEYSQCGKSFGRPSPLIRHKQTPTGERPHKCYQCGKGFTAPSHLARHERTHTGERPYCCSQCGKSFTRIDGLKVHQRTHTGVFPFHCSQCGNGFGRLHRLTRHLLIHSGECSYKCSQCGKSFSRSSTLTVHQRTHTDGRPYKCSQCGKCFMWSSKLRKHERTHTRVRPL